MLPESGRRYAMLQEGHRLREQGYDVVIGLRRASQPAGHCKVDGRTRDSGAASLNIGGITVREMDVDGM